MTIEELAEKLWRERGESNAKWSEQVIGTRRSWFHVAQIAQAGCGVSDDLREALNELWDAFGADERRVRAVLLGDVPEGNLRNPGRMDRLHAAFEAARTGKTSEPLVPDRDTTLQPVRCLAEDESSNRWCRAAFHGGDHTFATPAETCPKCKRPKSAFCGTDGGCCVAAHGNPSCVTDCDRVAAALTEHPIAPGDVVYLKSGGPSMTVGTIDEDGDAMLSWFDRDGRPCEWICEVVMLVRADA